MTLTYFVPCMLQTSPLKLLKNGELPTRFLRLVDETDSAPVKIALFGKEAEDNYSAGDVIKVTETYPYKKGLSLSTKKQTKVEVYHVTFA